ncbi:DNA-binding domain-containing protein [Parabacteroides gordonii]|jgi:hypothetical protein|uniref:DNA-binding domain-containing protein n=1 Tax=Parabacteroides gordonii TaxID=574930 RepID=UPI00241D1F25|nr:DNA-binding domain-containing protein [Parabacteroides gordonii]
MKRVLYIILYALLLPLLATIYGCGPKEEKGTVDSRFNASYIANIGITESEKALALIDTAEQKELMTDFEINRLRAVVYHNGLSDNRKSLEYALKAYEDPTARDNIKGYLRLIGMVADQYYLNGNYPQASFRGIIENSQWNPAKNSITVNFQVGADLREAIKKTRVNIIGEKGSAYDTLE